MTSAIDANVIIAVLDGRDARHTAAIDVLESCADEQLLAHPLTIAECLVLAERSGGGESMMTTIAGLRIETLDINATCVLRLARLRIATRLRMPDCCVLDVALEHRASLVTFDGRLAVAAREAGVTVLPTPT